MLQAHGVPEIPAETVKIARAAFPKGSLAMKLRDELGMIYTDEQFSDLFPERGQPAASPARLALVIVLQFAEGLPGPASRRRCPRPHRLEVCVGPRTERSGL